MRGHVGGHRQSCFCASVSMATARALERLQKCARTPVCSMSARSRATATVSAASECPAGRGACRPHPRARSRCCATTVFGVQVDGEVEGRGVFHGAPHDQGVGDRFECIAHAHAAGLFERRHVGEQFSLQALGERAERVYERQPKRQARDWIICAMAGVSITGQVSGGSTACDAGATAARVSLSMVALYSSPGSRRRARRSTSPGKRSGRAHRRCVSPRSLRALR